MPPEPEKAADRAERLLIEAILNDTYRAGTFLPGERSLCKDLGVARPALREALQRLARDGWLEIQHGKPTTVTNYWHEGNLNVLVTLLKLDHSMLMGFIPDLLEMWSLLAPTYTRRAVETDPATIARVVNGFSGLDDRADPYARAQWRLHRLLCDLCGNPIYGLIFNSFVSFYRGVATRYYDAARPREQTRGFWAKLAAAAEAGDSPAAADAMRAHMERLLAEWDTYVHELDMDE